VELPLPWERLLWTGRSLRFPRRRYYLTDLRIVQSTGRQTDELAVDDIGDVQLSRSALQRWFGTWTLTIVPRSGRRRPLTLVDIRRAPQLAAALDLLASEPSAGIDASALRAALEWTPRDASPGRRERLVAAAALPVAVTMIVIGLHGQAPPPVMPPADDAIAPSGIKRSPEEIVRFMETLVMPWARTTLAPIVGSPDRVTCQTCHSDAAASREWRMPAVAVLPQPIFREMGWELYSAGMDPQLRNAIYGYTAESDKQSRAAYMREVVMPGMARLLHRPAYDFTRTYDYNRSHHAFGCYHCHRVS
jgi:hypothetical protein